MKKFKLFSIILLLMMLNSISYANEVTSSKGLPIASNMAEVIFGLFIVIACIFFLGYLVKKINTFKKFGDNSISIVAGMSVGTKERVLVVQVGSEQVLLGVTPSRIQYLHTLKEPINDHKNQRKNKNNNGFSNKLNEFINKGTA